MKKRRFSITKEQGNLLLSALDEYILIMDRCIDIAMEIGNSHMYEDWRKAEAKRLHDEIANYNWEI